MTISRSQMPRELYQAGTNPEAEKLAKELGISLLEAVRILNTMEDTSFMQKGFIEDRPDMNMGGIANLAMRRQYGLGGFVKSITKGVKSAVSGVTDAVTDFAKSDIGKIAIAVAAPYALSAMAPGFATLGGSGFAGAALRSGLTNLAVQGLTTGKFDLGQAAKAGVIGGAVNTGLRNYQQTGNAFTSGDVTTVGDVTTGGDVLESAVVQGPEQTFGEQLGRQTSLPTPTPSAPVEGFNDYYASETITTPAPVTQQTDAFTAKAPTTMRPFETSVQPQELLQEAEGGLKRPIGQGIQNIARTGIEKVKDYSASTFLKDPSQGVNLKNLDLGNIAKASIIPLSLLSALSVPKQPEETDFDYEGRLKLVRKFEDKYSGLAGVSRPDTITDYEDFFSERARVAIGGLPDVPMGEPRQNKGGVTEIDYRDTGGFVPVGIKEKADDVPAMLSKNEFVFTANAVRNAGNGDVEKGAERLYKTMKILENGGTV